MNKQQRKTLSNHAGDLRRLLETIQGWEDKDPGLDVRKALAGQVEDIRSEVENEADEEQTKYDNMSEGLQQGATGQALEASYEALQNAESSLGDCINQLEEEGEDGPDLEGAASDLDQAIDYIDEACSA